MGNTESTMGNADSTMVNTGSQAPSPEIPSPETPLPDVALPDVTSPDASSLDVALPDAASPGQLASGESQDNNSNKPFRLTYEQVCELVVPVGNYYTMDVMLNRDFRAMRIEELHQWLEDQGKSRYDEAQQIMMVLAQGSDLCFFDGVSLLARFDIPAVQVYADKAMNIVLLREMERLDIPLGGTLEVPDIDHDWPKLGDSEEF